MLYNLKLENKNELLQNWGTYLSWAGYVRVQLEKICFFDHKDSSMNLFCYFWFYCRNIDGWMGFFCISDSSRRRGIVGFKSHRTAPPTEFANQPGFFAIQPFALVWNISRQILPEYLHPYLPLLLHHLWNCTTGHCK